MVITTIRRPRLVHQSAELGSKRCREMRRTKIWASVPLSPFLTHLSMLSLVVKLKGKVLSKQPNYLKGINIQSQPWSDLHLALSWLFVQQPVEQTSKTWLFVCLRVVFVCLFVSWWLVQCQPVEQTSISRCSDQVPSKRTSRVDEDLAWAAELNQRCWSM